MKIRGDYIAPLAATGRKTVGPETPVGSLTSLIWKENRRRRRSGDDLTGHLDADNCGLLKDTMKMGRELARGPSNWELVSREVGPYIVAAILAEVPIRFAYCIAIVATLAFLGFGAEPPAVDWGTMINQNKGGLTLQPWPVVAPVLCIAFITVGANLLSDALRTRLTSKSGIGAI